VYFSGHGLICREFPNISLYVLVGTANGRSTVRHCRFVLLTGGFLLATHEHYGLFEQVADHLDFMKDVGVEHGAMMLIITPLY